jgi:uncharacterized phage protein (TIGR01671 family)
MNREIKFRFWNREQKKFYYANTLESIRLVGKEAGNIPLNWMIEQQYTGLKDKNDREIYEGDIIKYPYYEMDEYHFKYFQVLWDDFFKAWALADDSGQPFAHTGWKFYNCDMGEVVGNIFENPKLLKN